MRTRDPRYALCCMQLLLASCACSAASSAFEPGTLPARWIRAIEQQDWPAMGEMLAEYAVYEDTTKREWDTHPTHVVGAQAIVDFWSKQATMAGTSRLDYTLLGGVETGGVTVLHVRLDVRESDESRGVEQDGDLMSCRGTIVLTVDDGKIVHVHDRLDLGDLEQQEEKE